MKKSLLVALVLVLAVGVSWTAYGADEKDVIGVWATARTDKGYAKVRIYEEGGKYFGEIVWLERPVFEASEGPAWEGKPKVDRQNPDKSKQSQPIVGLKIVQNMRYVGNGQWDGGTIYDPENGKTYKSKMTLASKDKLDVRGFIGISLLGRTSHWTRTDTP